MVCCSCYREYCSPVRTAINIAYQCFTKQTPDFTPENVKSGVFLLKGLWANPPCFYTFRLFLSNSEVFAFRCSMLLLNNFAFFVFPVARHNIYKPIGVVQKSFGLDLT